MTCFGEKKGKKDMTFLEYVEGQVMDLLATPVDSHGKLLSGDEARWRKHSDNLIQYLVDKSISEKIKSAFDSIQSELANAVKQQVQESILSLTEEQAKMRYRSVIKDIKLSTTNQ